MVRALLAGTKTQTRRVFKLPTKGIYERPDMGGWEATINGGGGTFTIGRDGTRTPAPERIGIWHQTTGRCLNAPFQIGDRLWVKETFTAHWGRAEPGAVLLTRARVKQSDGTYFNASEDEPLATYYAADIDVAAPQHCRRVSSRFMPRWASRLTLIVTDVRVQRLQEISQADCLAEGPPAISSEPSMVDGGIMVLPDADKPWHTATPRAWYHMLWDAINAKRGYGWDTNPWVVAITFDVHRCNIDLLGEVA